MPHSRVCYSGATSDLAVCVPLSRIGQHAPNVSPEISGALYHVIVRGNARHAIVLDDRDRRRFLGVLERVVSRFHLVLHAYCL